MGIKQINQFLRSGEMPTMARMWRSKLFVKSSAVIEGITEQMTDNVFVSAVFMLLGESGVIA